MIIKNLKNQSEVKDKLFEELLEMKKIIMDLKDKNQNKEPRRRRRRIRTKSCGRRRNICIRRTNKRNKSEDQEETEKEERKESPWKFENFSIDGEEETEVEEEGEEEAE